MHHKGIQLFFYEKSLRIFLFFIQKYLICTYHDAVPGPNTEAGIKCDTDVIAHLCHKHPDTFLVGTVGIGEVVGLESARVSMEGTAAALINKRMRQRFSDILKKVPMFSTFFHLSPHRFIRDCIY